MSFRIFSLLSPNTNKAIIPQKGDIIQKINTQPIGLRHLFSAIRTGRKIYNHKNSAIAAIINKMIAIDSFGIIIEFTVSWFIMQK